MDFRIFPHPSYFKEQNVIEVTPVDCTLLTIPHLRTETNPVSETMCFFKTLDIRQS
jgi:hypothetical protein